MSGIVRNSFLRNESQVKTWFGTRVAKRGMCSPDEHRSFL